MDLAVVVMSGGLDSCVAAAMAQAAGCTVAGLHVTYGQLTEQRERQAFESVCAALGIVQTQVVKIDYLRQFGGSALVDRGIELAEGADIDRPGIPASYVPQRNGNILMIAAAWADVLQAGSIWTGMVQADAIGYPDCRRSFCDAMQAAIAEGNHDEHPNPRVVTPLIDLSKAEIVQRGLALGAPLHLTWSCYQSEDVACGRCDSCQLRLRGFAGAGAKDPISYR